MIAPNYPRVDFELTADPGAAIGLIPPGGAEALDLPKMPPELPRWNSRQVQRSSTRTKQFGLVETVSRMGLCVAVVPVLAVGLIRLLFEWQRRRTLIAVVRQAPRERLSSRATESTEER